MSFVLIMLLTTAVSVRVETANATITQQQLQARENARLGVMMALGQLQKLAGPDQRATVRADAFEETAVGAENWSAIYDTTTGNASSPVWLVSGEQPSHTTSLNEANSSTVFPATTSISAVRVEPENIFDSEGAVTGNYAYWTEEQNVKARINRANDTAAMDYLNTDEERQNVAESLLLFPAQDKIFSKLSAGSAQPIASDIIERMNKVISEGQLELFLNDELGDYDFDDAYHAFSVHSKSVLEDYVNGGLKVNLTGRTRNELDELLAMENYREDSYLSGDYISYNNINEASGQSFAPNDSSSNFNVRGDLVFKPVEDFYDYRSNNTNPENGDFQPVHTIMPIVSEASFRLGAFHTQSDAKHRIRFHADVEFWNPYPFPIRIPNERQNRAFIIMLLPSEMEEPDARGRADREKMILSVEKMAVGRGRGGTTVPEESLHTNLFDFDENLRNAFDPGTNNSISSTTLSSWMVIDDVVLQPGEVYHATTEQDRGLARDLGGYILKVGGDPDDSEDYIVDPAHDHNKWSWQTSSPPRNYPALQQDDDIRINLRMPANGLTMRLVAFDSRTENRSPIFEDDTNFDEIEPIWELRHIYQGGNPPELQLRGDEYSRATSGGYTVNNYNIGFHFRLADELIVGANPTASDLAIRFDLRSPVWDFENEAVQQLVDITEEDPFLVSQTANLFDEVDILADANPDTHAGNYERAYLYSAPQSEPLSIGSLHRLPLSYETVQYDSDEDGTEDPVQIKIGMPWADDHNQAFDKYFYTGVPATGWELGKPLPVSPLLPKPSTTAEKLREADSASELLVQGGFNINSVSESAWSAMLSRILHNWRYGTNSPIDLKNSFLNLGDNTDLAIESVGILEDETELTNFSPSGGNAAVVAGRLAMRQPLRRLTDDQIQELAEAIVDNISERLSAGQPFVNIAEFVNSGVLERAIRSSNINSNIADFSPAYISQNIILETLAPYLTIRSDTFVIHAMGMSVNPATGLEIATARCQAIVQRIPDRVDGDISAVTENSTTNNNPLGRKFVILSWHWTNEEI